MDNCEHLLDAAAQLIGTVMRSCPDVRVIATSREPLGVSGESVHRIKSLAYPGSTSGLSVENALQYSAIALFVERATAVRPQYRLTQDTISTVADICRRLDGIALAIELAAARVRVLSVAHLNERLTERFRLLTGGSRTALPRHQTMRALIDWSARSFGRT